MADRVKPTMLVDTSYLFFRAFHGVPDTLRTPDGHPVNAVRGVLDFLTTLVSEHEPSDIVCCWDEDWRPAWRVDLLPAYKAHRVVSGTDDEEEVPDALARQVPWIRAVLDALGIPVIGASGAEADDVIATLAAASPHGAEVVTGDRDLLQLVDDARAVSLIWVAHGVAKRQIVTEAWVQDRYGVTPQQYVEFAALRGDPSDGLPGVRGIGDKTAATLLNRFGTLTALIDAARDPNAEGLTRSQRSKVLDSVDYLQRAVRVITVKSDLTLTPAQLQPVDHAAVAALSERWGLGSSAERLVEVLDSYPEVR